MECDNCRIFGVIMFGGRGKVGVELGVFLSRLLMFGGFGKYEFYFRFYFLGRFLIY